MKEFYLLNNNNQKINIIEGKNLDTNNIIMIHVHGLGSHFQPLYKCLDCFEKRDNIFAKFFIKSFALEFHGHGKSDGITCAIHSFDDLLDDLDTLIFYLGKRFKDTSIYILGESMGCAVALKYCIERPNNIKGLIFLAPMFGIDDKLIPNYFLKQILYGLSFIFPNLPIIHSKHSTISTDNQEFIEAKKENKFSYRGNQRLCTCRELLKISKWIEENGHLLETPVLIFHGLKDYVTQPKITEQLFNKMISKNKKLYLLKEGYHCLLINSKDNPLLPALIMGKIISWINKKNKKIGILKK